MKSLNYDAYLIVIILMVQELGVNGVEERNEEGWEELQGYSLCVLIPGDVSYFWLGVS